MKERLHRLRQKGAEYGVTKQNVALVWMVAIVSLSLVSGVTAAQETTDDETQYAFVGTFDGQSVEAYNLESSSKAWETSIGEGVFQVETGPNRYVYAAANGRLAKLDPSDGTVEWNRNASEIGAGTISDFVVMSDGDVIVGSNTGEGGKAHRYNPGDGTVEWSYDTPGTVYGVDVGPSGNVWFSYSTSDRLVKLTPDGTELANESTGVDNFRNIEVTSDGDHAYIGLNELAKVSTSDYTTDWVVTPNGGVRDIHIDSSGDVFAAFGTASDEWAAEINKSDGSYVWQSSPGIDNGDSIGSYPDSVHVWYGTNNPQSIYKLNKSDGNSQSSIGTGDLSDVALGYATPITPPPETSANLTLKHNRYMEFGTTQPYTVIYENETGRHNVTSDANVSSANTSVVAFNLNHTMTATSDENVSVRVTTRANYTLPNGTVIEDTNYVAVAKPDVENLEVLPPIWRFSASIGSPTIQAILVAVFMGVLAGRLAGGFAGLGMMQLVMVAGWFIGYVSVGMAMISLFTALFIGLNMAANIDYTVTRG